MYDENAMIKRVAKFVGLAIVVFLGLGVLFGSVYTVDQSETVLVLRGGKIITVSSPGYNMKIPFIDSLVSVSNRTFTYQLKQQGMNSYDQQPAFLDLSITLSVPKDKSDDLYREFGSLEGAFGKVIAPQTSTIKEVFGKYKAAIAYQERDRLAAEVSEALKNAVLKQTDIIKIHSVQIENLTFSKAYEQAVEERMRVEVDVTKQQQQLAKEKIQADITVTQADAQAKSSFSKAEGEAKSILAVAEAKAKARLLEGEAEAKAIKAQTDALQAGGSNLVNYVIANKYKGDVPNTVLGGGKDFVPFLNMKQ